MIITSERIRQRIAAFMKDVNEELWKLGVPCQDTAQRSCSGTA